MAAEQQNRVASVAREALELVCTGERLNDANLYYSEHFLDHVNAREYRGLDGVRRSVALYQQLFDKPRFEVLDQVSEGDSVASRFVIHGVHRGRFLRVPGIVISRIEGNKIVEDFAAIDTFEVLRQLGVWRALLFAASHPRALKH